MKKNNNSEWFKKKEVIDSKSPIYLTFWCLKHFPKILTYFIIFQTAAWYYFFNKNARTEAVRYQKQLQNFVGKEKYKKIHPFRQIFAFAITVVEKVDCWTKKKSLADIHFNDDDVHTVINQLNNKQGVFFFISHLGNAETLRNFANAANIGTERKVPVASLIDIDVTSNFSQALKKLNPEFIENTINVNDINPATIERLQDIIAQGGIVVCAGDRISKNKASRNIELPFLGKDAPFSYGAYVLAALLKAPVYFVNSVRQNPLSFNGKYEMFVKKASTDLNVSRREREPKIKELCTEFKDNLESLCIKYPDQWYNFFNFWENPEKQNTEKVEH